jgi:hypothetical protein
MSYRILQDEYYEPGLGPLGPGLLGIRYNPKTGDYELKGKSALGYDVGIGLPIFYQNGSWSSDAIRDPKLFENGDRNKPTQLARDLALDINKKVYAAYITLNGPNTGDVVINSAGLPENHNNMGVENRFPGTTPPVDIPGVTTPPGEGNLLDPGIKVNATFGLPDARERNKNSRLLTYPKDLLQNQQDTFRITRYVYTSPYENIFSGDANIKNILTQGPSRTQITGVKESLIGTVILPMPNTVRDSNNTSWGDDNLNSLATAATAQVMKDPAGSGIVQAVAAAAEAFNIPGANKFPQLVALGRLAEAGGMDNANIQTQIKAAMSSFLLSKQGFDVSPESILARGLGIVPNSNLQLLFNNVTLRQFGFSYKMSPRNKDEAANVRRIIRFFKEGMAAKKQQGTGGGGASLFLGTPDVFKLEYKSENKDIKGVNKFKICALQSFAVNYTAENQWESYADSEAPGQPVSLIMEMQFKEIEPIYDTDYQTTNLLDQPSISSADDVGF